MTAHATPSSSDELNHIMGLCPADNHEPCSHIFDGTDTDKYEQLLALFAAQARQTEAAVLEARIDENQQHIDDIDLDIDKLGPLGNDFLQQMRKIYTDRIAALTTATDQLGGER